jgi:death on curing protein
VKCPRWIDTRALLLLHAESLAEHGGLTGLRDQNALEAALARPQHVFRYEPGSDLSRLAAAYGFGLVRDHPFHDGNKRAGFLAILLFLDLSRFELRVEQVEAIQVIIKMAAGKMRESELAEWIRAHLRRARKT